MARGLALLAIALTATTLVSATPARWMRTGHLPRPEGRNATTAAPPPPTWPPPKFNGYIMLAQYVCDDLLCPDWSLAVTRLATECFTWDCQFEETIMTTVVPKSPIRRMSFPVLTAYRPATRHFYTVGITNVPPGSATYWLTSVDPTVNGTKLLLSNGFLFPNITSVLVSVDVTTLNGTEVLIAVFQDGTIASVDPPSGTLTVLGDALSGNSTRVLNQATALVEASQRIYLYSDTPTPGAPGFVTYDLVNNRVLHDVRVAPLPYNTIPPAAFQVTYVPPIKQLVFFSTGLFDQLIYVDPATGASSYAIEDLYQDDQMTFYDDPSVKTDDTYKNNAYDEQTNMLYFQATQRGNGDGPVTSLISVGPFTEGPPQPLYYVWMNLSPIDFGYQGMHYAHCHPKCPT